MLAVTCVCLVAPLNVYLKHHLEVSSAASMLIFIKRVMKNINQHTLEKNSKSCHGNPQHLDFNLIDSNHRRRY